MDEPSDCPYIGCATFLDEMKKRHNYNAEAIVWGYATQKNLWMDNLERNTVEYHIPSFLFSSSSSSFSFFFFFFFFLIFCFISIQLKSLLTTEEYNPSKQCQCCCDHTCHERSGVSSAAAPATSSRMLSPPYLPPPHTPLLRPISLVPWLPLLPTSLAKSSQQIEKKQDRNHPIIPLYRCPVELYNTFVY